jgi:hypothetical protein
MPFNLNLGAGGLTIDAFGENTHANSCGIVTRGANSPSDSFTNCQPVAPLDRTPSKQQYAISGDRQLFVNARRSAFNCSACVIGNPCAAPSYTFS